jgi:hypothetical protein
MERGSAGGATHRLDAILSFEVVGGVDLVDACGRVRRRNTASGAACSGHGLPRVAAGSLSGGRVTRIGLWLTRHGS